MRIPVRRLVKHLSVGSSDKILQQIPTPSRVIWDVNDHIAAHKAIRASGGFNYEICRIPVPTSIRYDRLRLALGDDISPKERKVLELIEFGFPLSADSAFGVRRPQKNHQSALTFASHVEAYLNKGVESKAILGPFEVAPISDLCYSPLMTVPKEVLSRRVIVDFSFPAGRAINDGIPRDAYLDCEVEFCLPSVKSMIARVNSLGKGCMLFKRDLKSAFRQFHIDPGDYRFSGLCWKDIIYIDTRLAMGLRSASFCCQSVTEMVAKVANDKAFILVYLDDFGGGRAPKHG